MDPQQALIGSFAASPPAWFAAEQADARQRFAKVGLPSRTHEDWRYTSLRGLGDKAWKVAPRQNQKSSQTLGLAGDTESDLTVHVCNGYVEGIYGKAARGLEVSPLSTAWSPVLRDRFENWSLAQESLVLFNQATVQEGLYIRIGGENNRVTIRYTNHAGGDQLMSFRVLVDVSGSGQIVEIIESETGVGLTNLRSQILVNPQGYLTHLRQQALGADGTHFSNVEARVARDGTYRGFTATVSGRIVRNDCTILLQETNATGHFDGIFMAREGQHVDNCFLVDHQASETHSSQNFRGILGAGGRGVFAGKIWLREAATRSDAKQLNQNLMLADDCEMDTKPQLKIDTDEVKCSHGASVGRPSEQELFYLASRGISRGDALAMISRGFLRAALWDNTPTVLQQQISQASAGFFQMLQEQQ